MAISSSVLQLKDKHMYHQNGNVGKLLIRPIEARGLQVPRLSFTTPSCNPYVVFQLYEKESEQIHLRRKPRQSSTCSSVVIGSTNPSWKKEILSLNIPKLLYYLPGSMWGNYCNAIEHCDERIILQIDVMNEDSIAGKAREFVGASSSSGTLIGSAILDTTILVEGKKDLLDIHIPLLSGTKADCSNYAFGGENALQVINNGKSISASIRLILEYEPIGLDPQIGDGVRFEGYGPYPTALLPPFPLTEFRVINTSGNYLLCTFKYLRDNQILSQCHGTLKQKESEWDGAIRAHRNLVFVSSRYNLWDQLYDNIIVHPVEIISHTPAAKMCWDAVGPTVKATMTLCSPFIVFSKRSIVAGYNVMRAVIATSINSMQ